MTNKTIQGLELKEKTDKNGKIKTGQYELGQRELNSIYDCYGITKEVRDTLQRAEEAIIDDALRIATETVCEEPDCDRSTVTLGRGDQRLRVGVTGVKEQHTVNPQSGVFLGKRTKYGAADIHQHRKFPSGVKSRISQAERECRAYYANKREAVKAQRTDNEAEPGWGSTWQAV